MGFEDIRRVIEERMALWTVAPVDYDGAPKGPDLQDAIDKKESWVRLSINHGNSFTAGLGSSPEVRRTGLVQLQIFTPEDEGSGPAAKLADSLASHFEYYTSGKLETLAASVQRVGPSNLWYQYNVSLPFRAG